MIQIIVWLSSSTSSIQKLTKHVNKPIDLVSVITICLESVVQTKGKETSYVDQTPQEEIGINLIDGQHNLTCQYIKL